MFRLPGNKSQRASGILAVKRMEALMLSPFTSHNQGPDDLWERLANRKYHEPATIRKAAKTDEDGSFDRNKAEGNVNGW